jgi:hypothetical protein
MSANPVKACFDTLSSPTLAFDTVKDKKRWSWMPFITLLLTSALVFVYYFMQSILTGKESKCLINWQPQVMSTSNKCKPPQSFIKEIP